MHLSFESLAGCVLETLFAHHLSVGRLFAAQAGGYINVLEIIGQCC